MADEEKGLAGKTSEEISMNSISDDSCSKSKERIYLESLLNKTFRIKISDGRTLVGSFLCTDREQNVILGQCLEYVDPNGLENGEEARTLGLAMVPGRHIVSIELDTNIPQFRIMEQSVGKVNFAVNDS